MMFLKPSEKKKSNSRKTLFLISSLLFGSAILRVVVGANSAIALETSEPDMLAMTHADADSEYSGVCEPAPELADILAELAERESRVADREKKIKSHFATLKLAETEIQKNLVALEQAEKDLEKTMALAAVAAETDLTQLTTVYENMKPKKAAELFQEMPPEFAAGFLGRMRPDSAAAIMAGLDANIAYSISVVLAGRNANAAKE